MQRVNQLCFGPGFGYRIAQLLDLNKEAARCGAELLLVQPLPRDRSSHCAFCLWSKESRSNPSKALAFAESEAEFTLGRILVSDAEWQFGDPLQLLGSLRTDLDVIASILPFGTKSGRSIVLNGIDGTPVELRGDLGNLILAAATARLSKEGVGFFVVLPSFFLSQRSVLRQFPALGFGVEAALALPSGSFAPLTSVPTYLVVVRKHPVSRMFVAQLSSDVNANIQIVANLNESQEGGRLELGRFVDPQSFTGLDSIRITERLNQVGSHFGAPAVRLEELATAINLGRFGEDFKFQKQQNAIFIPLIGIR
jgi:hypothetical protein